MPNAVTTELQQCPLPEIIERLGAAVANAQFAMDQNSLRIARMMGDVDACGVQVNGEDRKRSLLELGFTPNFYHFAEATIESRMTFSMAQSTETSLSVSATVGVAVYFVTLATTVNAAYTNKYSFEATGSSSMTTRLVAVPPPSLLATLLASRGIAPDPKPKPAPAPTPP